MLQLTIPPRELWDNHTQEFVYTKGRSLTLEHSLVSVSKWEAKYHKPFLSTEQKTREETIEYIKCMTITQNVAPDVYLGLTPDNFKEVNEYIADSMTATQFREESGSKSKSKTITSELIYYWMISLNIPVKFEKWHLNRLLTLIRVCNAEQQPAKKMSKKDIYSNNAALNAARRKALGSKG